MMFSLVHVDPAYAGTEIITVVCSSISRKLCYLHAQKQFWENNDSDAPYSYVSSETIEDKCSLRPKTSRIILF